MRIAIIMPACFYSPNEVRMRLDRSEDSGTTLEFYVDGQPWIGREGDTIAGALYAAGIRAWRKGKDGTERGLLCGMGICYECQVIVDGIPGVRACQEHIRPGMMVETSLRVAAAGMPAKQG